MNRNGAAQMQGTVFFWSGLTRNGVELDNNRKSIRNQIQQPLVFVTEDVFLVTVNIDLAKNLFSAANQHDDFRARFNAASEVVIAFRHVADYLVLTFEHRRAAYTVADGNVCVLGRLADVVVQHERIAFQQVDAYPVITITRVLDDSNGFAKQTVARGGGSDRLVNPAQCVLIVHGLIRRTSINDPSPLLIAPGRSYDVILNR